MRPASCCRFSTGPDRRRGRIQGFFNLLTAHSARTARLRWSDRLVVISAATNRHGKTEGERGNRAPLPHCCEVDDAPTVRCFFALLRAPPLLSPDAGGRPGRFSIVAGGRARPLRPADG